MISIRVLAPAGVDVPKAREVDPNIGQVIYAVLRIDEQMRMQGLRAQHVQESTHPCSRITHTVTLTYRRE